MRQSTPIAIGIIIVAIFVALVFSISNPLVNLRDPGADADSTNTSSDSGLEFLNNELTLLRGCSDGQVLVWDETNDEWDCGAN